MPWKDFSDPCNPPSGVFSRGLSLGHHWRSIVYTATKCNELNFINLSLFLMLCEPAIASILLITFWGLFPECTLLPSSSKTKNRNWNSNYLRSLCCKNILTTAKISWSWGCRSDPRNSFSSSSFCRWIVRFKEEQGVGIVDNPISIWTLDFHYII